MAYNLIEVGHKKPLWKRFRLKYAKHQAEPATNHWLGRSFPLKMHVCKNIPKHLDHIWKTLAIVALWARCSLKLLGHPSDIRPYIYRWFTTKSSLNKAVFLAGRVALVPKIFRQQTSSQTPFKKTVASKRTFAAASTQDQNQGWPTYAKDDV